AAREEVPRHLRLPHRLLDHRPAVVGAHLRPELGHGPPPRRRPGGPTVPLHERVRARPRIRHDRSPKSATIPAPTAIIAAAAAAHMPGRCFVVTTGSGGRP